MVMENEMKGAMNQMSNLCEILIEKTRGQVTYEKLVQSIDNIMESFSVSLEKACQVQKTTVEEYYRAKEFLGMK